MMNYATLRTAIIWGSLLTAYVIVMAWLLLGVFQDVLSGKYNQPVEQVEMIKGYLELTPIQ